MNIENKLYHVNYGLLYFTVDKDLFDIDELLLAYKLFGLFGKENKNRRISATNRTNLYLKLNSNLSDAYGKIILMINFSYTDDTDIEALKKYLYDTIIDADIDEDYFNFLKKGACSQYESNKEYPQFVAFREVFELLMPNYLLEHTEKVYDVTYEGFLKARNTFLENASLKTYIFDKKKVDLGLEKYFKPLTFNKKIKDISNKGDVKSSFDVDQTFLINVFKFDMTDFEKYIVLPVFNVLYAGGANSKLFRRVREELSLCYFITGSLVMGLNLLIISSGVRKGHEKEVKYEILKTLKSFEVDQEEAAEAKEFIINQLKVKYQKPQLMLKIIANDEHFSVYDYEETLRLLKTIDKKDINNLSKKFEKILDYTLGDNNV